MLDKRESKSKDDRGVVHVETIGYNQDGKVVCIFRRKVMVPKSSYLEARGGEQPGRPVPQPDRNWPGVSADSKLRGQREQRQHQHHGYGEADAQRVGADQAGEHRAEQRADVVELVEPADHHVHPGLPDRGRDLGAAGDPRGGGEAQRRDHRDAEPEQREAQHRDLPRRRGHDHQQRQGRDHGAGPEHRHRAEPGHQAVPGSRITSVASR